MAVNRIDLAPQGTPRLGRGNNMKQLFTQSIISSYRNINC